MNRLIHDPASLLMACKMSRTDFFCFVEGVDNDKYFYSQLTKTTFQDNDLKAEFPSANVLTPEGRHGGKTPLISFFRYLNSVKSLKSDFKGKTTTFVFLLDKDVDELKKIHVRSKYILYTEHYDLQNYLFMHGDVINAAAAGASITVDSLVDTLGDKNSWAANCTTTWKEWVTICLFLRINDLSLAGYAKSSEINVNEYGPVDQRLLNSYRALALKKSGLDKAIFDTRYSEVEGLVDTFYAKGKANKIFKGKWYLHWLVNHLKTQHLVNINCKQLAGPLSLSLNWSDKWARPYKLKLSRLVRDHRS